jgi:hypothetical protein
MVKLTIFTATNVSPRKNPLITGASHADNLQMTGYHTHYMYYQKEAA